MACETRSGIFDIGESFQLIISETGMVRLLDRFSGKTYRIVKSDSDFILLGIRSDGTTSILPIERRAAMVSAKMDLLT